MMTSKLLSSCIVMLSILGLFLLTAVGNISAAAEGLDDLTTIEEHRCGAQIDPADPYLDLVNEVLDYLAVETPNQQPNFELRKSETRQGFTVCGYADCEDGYTAEQCSECLSACVGAFYPQCGSVVGARIQMTACYMRYEDYSFK